MAGAEGELLPGRTPGSARRKYTSTGISKPTVSNYNGRIP